jgi:hypothetical protein
MVVVVGLAAIVYGLMTLGFDKGSIAPLGPPTRRILNN